MPAFATPGPGSGNIEVGIGEGTTASIDVNSERGAVHDFVSPQGVGVGLAWRRAPGGLQHVEGRGPDGRGRMVELISRELTGAENFMLGLAWLDPGDVHLLHHHPHADEWYYVIGGSAVFTVGTEQVRSTTGTAIFKPAGTGDRIHNDGAETLHFAWGFNRPDLTEVGIVWDE